MRTRQTATLLPDGRLLVAGGLGAGDGGLSSAEAYDPASGSWSATGSLAHPRGAREAILLRTDASSSEAGSILAAASSRAPRCTTRRREFGTSTRHRAWRWVAAGSYLITVFITGIESVPRLTHVLAEPVNHPPAIDPIDAQVVEELLTLSFLVAAAEPDPGDTLTFTLEPDAPTGTAIDPATGEFAWKPDEAQGPGPHTVTVQGVDTFTCTLVDGALSAVGVVTLTVGAVYRHSVCGIINID